MKGLALIMAAKPKDKGAPAEKPESPESEAEESGGYKSLIRDSAKAGDWDAFADAVAGYVRECSTKEE